MRNKKLMAFWGIIVLFYLAANFAHPVTPTLIVERGLDSSMFGVALAAMMATPEPGKEILEVEAK